MSRVAAALVILIALAEAGFIALFAFLSLGGDGLGIARAMAMLLAVPFLAGAVPALFVLRAGWPRAALAVATVSLAATWGLWHLA